MYKSLLSLVFILSGCASTGDSVVDAARTQNNIQLGRMVYDLLQVVKP